MVFTDIIASIVTGGATGLLGAIVSRVGDYKNKQLDILLQKEKLSNEIELRHADARIMELEWQSRERIAVVESESKSDVADSESFKSALTSEPRQYADPTKFTKVQNSFMVFLDLIRGIVRPGLTIYLCGITTAIYFQAERLLDSQPLTPQMAVDMHSQITATIMYLTVTVVLFWFGTRNKDKKKNG